MFNFKYIGKNHDLCPLYFLKDNIKYGYKYNNFVTLSHCECDKIVNIFIVMLYFTSLAVAYRGQGYKWVYNVPPDFGILD